MAGGESTRLWPLSTSRVPKPFLRLVGDRTLLQATADRLRPLVGWRRMLVVGHRRHARLVREQLAELPEDNALSEPVGRNTAACLRYAAEWLMSRYGDVTMIAVPADHYIRDESAAQRALSAAAEIAEREHCLVVVGVPPRGPDTGYGYILPRPAAATKGRGGKTATHLWVQRFIEKPMLARARALLRAGALWNAGVFVWRISDFIAALEQCAPQYNRAFEGLFDGKDVGSPAKMRRRLRRVYEAIANQPVDVALLQNLTSRKRPIRALAAVRGDFDWDDIGSWDRVGAAWGADADGNTCVGSVMCIDSHGCVVHAGSHKIVVLGGQDLVIVSRRDVTLVADKKRAQEVRRLLPLVRERGWES